ncbi:28S ribosomal mitochondrial [Micractinium conductrix]|uniref:Small ribosomal subunit protein mS29 n=1 Tax=Micractinium conductrix TaxID=554055 RepID=A0A2P6V786_9CHLO|nr:28S ribosomal mitochondrial [Micractinium conductrix]|eukprot:PSC69955.1 28S ribosomal mitochondrial [Micractinium conductrix]
MRLRALAQALQAAGGSQLAASLRVEQQPAASAAWHLQCRGAAAAAAEPGSGVGEQPAAAEPAVAPAAPSAKPQPKAKQQASKPPPGKQQAAGKAKAAGKQPAGQQPAGKPAAANAAGKPAGEPYSKPQPKQAAPSLLSGLGVAALPEVPVNTYFEVPAGVLPEATADYYKDPVLKGENVNEPNFGCKAVQREWDWSGRRSLLARACMRDLLAAVQSKERPQLYLDGWAGSGKSVALYSAVAWARANGWLALYVPSAFSLVQNGTFSRGEDGLWDTPEAARWILTSLRDAHAEQLPALKTPAGQPLDALVEEGLAAGAAPGAVVGAALAAKDSLAAQQELPVLLAVDDYNALYSRTGYYESVHNFHRRQLAPEELRLARGFRLLEQPPPANGVAITAPTLGQTISASLRLPRPPRSRVAVPRLSLPELQAAGQYFSSEVMKGNAPTADEASLRRALFLTNGNAAELRAYMPGLLGLGDDLLGVSRGYKAEARRRDAHNLGAVP